MKSFLELDVLSLKGAQVIIDIDGTLGPDKISSIPEEILARLRELKEGSKVYLCSNGSPKTAAAFAAQVGVESFIGRKPWPFPAKSILERNRNTVVIGDKYLTDGLFAKALGAMFIKVKRVRGAGESGGTKLVYWLDDLSWLISSHLAILRPAQWVKNILVFAPLFFAGGIFAGQALENAILTFIIFCLASGAIYAWNDVVDVEKDRAHSRKRFRPLAAGHVSHFSTYVLIFIVAIILAALLVLVPSLIALILFYLILNIAYSNWLKHVVVVDIMTVSLFYLLRIVAGGLAASVPLSPWIMLCALFGALFVITGKRLAESQRGSRRAVLEEYSPGALNFILAACAALAIMAYGIYSVIGHDSDILVYSTIFVALALFRLLNRIYTHPEEAEAPEILVFKDRWILFSFLAWVVYVFLVFYIL